MDMERMIKTLELQEGRRANAYPDSKGIPTVGIGLNLRDVGYKGKKYKSVADFNKEYPNGLTDDQIDEALIAELEHHIDNAIDLAESKGVNWDELGSLRQEVIVNMVYNMGKAGVGGFPSMWRHLADGNYVGAALEMLHGSRGNLSKYTLDTKMRAVKLAMAMATDSDEAIFAL